MVSATSSTPAVNNTITLFSGTPSAASATSFAQQLAATLEQYLSQSNESAVQINIQKPAKILTVAPAVDNILSLRQLRRRLPTRHRIPALPRAALPMVTSPFRLAPAWLPCPHWPLNWPTKPPSGP